MGITSRKIVVAGATIATVSLALLFSQLGIPFGLGTGTGDGNSESSQNDSSDLENTHAVAPSPTAPMFPDNKVVVKPEKPDTSEMISVVVVGTGYRWATNEQAPKSVEEISLDQIVEKAKAAKGNAQGVRARIFHAGSALPSAENQLMDALRQAGLSEESILFDQRIVDLDS
ncbi:hypothetical protein [Rubinisphaera sp.]|uniref:hypothetical protein n=1 Tax=Rubinisphaera sp. TaxID=2024857 RepID=UPI000C119BF9|nr:hypothetical protein [Rubinisphaera sp.]MBV11103.1 hypothetical protein [Rubinisphaera sp.]HCS51472.1 hypothetical protein [Planctomycetaceae bacterium]|tara:strand:+ start:4401 stop:4916 length:516 start_codon:yes stop_codon:yes gene_type:complete